MGLMHIKSVLAQSLHDGVVGKFGKLGDSLDVALITSNEVCRPHPLCFFTVRCKIKNRQPELQTPRQSSEL
ncbi:hypothetical protein TNCV_866481 [Trichonephila clavipes]|nr:hypothetical protein TNCV_866481 [Trichonephila clavipes]